MKENKSLKIPQNPKTPKNQERRQRQGDEEKEK